MIYSIEGKPTNVANSQTMEELLEMEAAAEAAPQPSYRFVNRGYENDAASKRQLKAFSENSVPRNAMDMMRALIALRRYRR
uniref:Uncharacterized protein n=1 Tax=Panagrolaimus davidi TaxID=227884 RepID=A0A914Q615_9BILA